MMKFSLSVLLFIFFVVLGQAQERAVEVLNKVYCLGVDDRSPNTSVTIRLPAKTVKWFYTVTATKSQSIAESVKDNPAIFSVFPDLITDQSSRKKTPGAGHRPFIQGMEIVPPIY